MKNMRKCYNPVSNKIVYCWACF